MVDEKAVGYLKALVADSSSLYHIGAQKILEFLDRPPRTLRLKRHLGDESSEVVGRKRYRAI